MRFRVVQVWNSHSQKNQYQVERKNYLGMFCPVNKDGEYNNWHYYDTADEAIEAIVSIKNHKGHPDEVLYITKPTKIDHITNVMRTISYLVIIFSIYFILQIPRAVFFAPVTPTQVEQAK